jgi:hypothetical protein
MNNSWPLQQADNIIRPLLWPGFFVFCYFKWMLGKIVIVNFKPWSIYVLQNYYNKVQMKLKFNVFVRIIAKNITSINSLKLLDSLYTALHYPNELNGYNNKTFRKIFPIHHLALIRKPLFYFIDDICEKGYKRCGFYASRYSLVGHSVMMREYFILVIYLENSPSI